MAERKIRSITIVGMNEIWGKRNTYISTIKYIINEEKE
jgi:hypothetical protein